MRLNIASIVYFFFRLSPFIVVSYFLLQSFFNQDLKGIIYLVGLLLTCFMAMLIGSLPIFNETVIKNPICNAITFNEDGKISNLPIGMIVLTYTSFYLGYVMIKYNLVSINIPALIIFPLLIVFELFWNLSNNCSGFMNIAFAGFIGALFGYFWALIVDLIGNKNLQFFNGLSNAEVCSRPSKVIYKCKNIPPTHP